ncbi:metallophosphoesterase [uncultured Pseudoflavonifractor sp.]|uniref:metallophosphoesterase n=1 Tax=uncultured Pseudoflavonifractor sp. TaxID=1221379 RepID=UPI0025E952C4|nr:metallophosphoesterase [uncultured Pseudoflavonifractor sp.]
MRRRRRWLLLAAAALLLLAAWVVWGVWRSAHRPVARTWQVEAGLPVRLAVLSDLHGCVFGEHNGELAALVAEQEPDLILLDGDMLNGDAPGPEDLLDLLGQLVEIAPVYYAWGNHEREYISCNTSDLRAQIEALGAVVLELDYVDLTVNGAQLRLGGMYDYAFALDDKNSCDPARMKPEVWQFLTDFQDTDRYKVMLSHRPDSFVFGEASVTWNVDLVVSGHLHGGQVVLPLLGGVFGGDQGLFPKYVHGIYEKDKLVLAVTSGLGSQPERLPRFNNPPEVMVLDLSA